MSSLKKLYVAGAVVALALLVAAVLSPEENGLIGSARIKVPETALFTTSTNANYSTVTPKNVNDFRHIQFTLAADSASGTLKFACSNATDAPTFSSAQSPTNRWDYVQVVDLEDQSTIDGDTGITLSDTSDVRQFEANINGSHWCTALLSGNDSPQGLGTTTVYIRGLSNQ